MATLKIDFLSKSLLREVPVTVILPSDKLYGQAPDKFQVLYLLHGLIGNHNSFLYGTELIQLAEQYNLAVVMPSGENHFWLDHPSTHDNYGEFIGEELPSVMARMLPLSEKREDTFIAGYSMGGYGALRNGLKYADRFGYAAGLSAAILTDNVHNRTNDAGQMFILRKDFAKDVYGDLDKVQDSDVSVGYLIRQRLAAGKVLPKLYMACGTEDKLLHVNKLYAAKLKEAGCDLTDVFVDGEGHTFHFWNSQLSALMEWLPVEDNGSINMWNAPI